MKKQIKTKYKTNGGAAMMTLVLFFVFISLTILIGIVTPTVREYNIASDSFTSKQTYYTAESGIEDVLYRLKNSRQADSIENLVLGDSSSITTITDIGGGRKEISTIGDTDSHQRKINVTLTTATGVSFNYGVLVGGGGVEMEGTGVINGNVYANGPIYGDSSSYITGTAISANSPAQTSSQSNGSGTPSYNITFAKYSSSQDVAQSFQLSEESPLNKVQLYVRKIGNPSSATVKIVNNSNGSPGSSVITSGTLSASAVTSSYGWINVSFEDSPILTTGVTYWIVVDASYSNSKYYEIGASGDNYANGVAKIGKMGGTWNNTSPSNLDYYFNIYLGGLTGLIQGDGLYNQLRVGTTSGTAQAHAVTAVNATGNIYCQVGSQNNKSCSSQPDPVYIAFPISDANIAQWEEDASTGGTYTGSYSVGWSGATIGPRVITGDLSIGGGGTLTVTGTIWVKGNLTLNGGGEINLASSYGSNDGVILVDGTVTVSGGGHADGSGTAGSYLMLLSRSTSTDAIKISGGSGAVIAYAPNGTIKLSGGASLKEATGYRLDIEGGSSVTYESGLTNNNFSSGPSGTWSVDSWKEVE